MNRSDHRTYWRLLNNNKLNEGLIKSWTNKQFQKFISKLLDQYGFDYEFESGEDYQSVLVKVFNLKDIPQKDKSEFFNNVQKLLNQSGFYSVIKEFEVGGFISSKSTIYIMEFAKKFNIEEDVPPYLYHVTHPQYLRNITKKGLVPKTKKLIEEHPDRIYVTDSIDDAETFASAKYSITDNEDYNEYVILKIDTSKLNNIKLYVDALKIPDTNMFYILDNIPPSAIEVIRKDIVNENKIITKFRNFK